MNAIRHGGFVSVFVHAPLRGRSWSHYRGIEDHLKDLTSWRQPGGTVEIILDDSLHYSEDRKPSWRFELVWYDRDIGNALLFKLSHGGANSLA
jgi:hypothetical protein